MVRKDIKITKIIWYSSFLTTSLPKCFGGGVKKVQGTLEGGAKKFRVCLEGGQKVLGKARGGSKKFSPTKIEIFQPPTQGIYERSLITIEKERGLEFLIRSRGCKLVIAFTTWMKNPLQNTWEHLFIPMMVISKLRYRQCTSVRYDTHELTLHDLDRKRFVKETGMTFSEKDVNKPWPLSFSGSFSEQGQRKPDQFRTFPSEVTTISLFPLICWVQNIVSINRLIKVISGGRRGLKNGGNWGEGPGRGKVFLFRWL